MYTCALTILAMCQVGVASQLQEPVYTQAVCGIDRGASWLLSQVVIGIRPFHPPMLPVHTIHSHVRLLKMNFISVLQVI